MKAVQLEPFPDPDMTIADQPSTMSERRIPTIAVTTVLALGLAAGCTSTATPTPRAAPPTPTSAQTAHGHRNEGTATPAERAAAADLLARTSATLAAYESEPAARAAGFLPHPSGSRRIHYRNVPNRRDDHALDPERPEGLVYFATATGGLRLLGAVFTVRAGEVAPAPGSDIFRWHTHDSSCPTFAVEPGACEDTFRMLHVWTTAGAEGSGGVPAGGA